MADRKFLFLLGSARTGGNTETLTRYAARELPSEVEQRWVRLSDVPLAPFVDRRHDGSGHGEPVGNERLLLDATLEATDVVIASPLYWYSVSADVKLYLDYWSGWLRVADFKARMRGKTLWAVSVLSEEPGQAEPLEGTLRRSAEYLGMRWGGVLLGNGSRPDDVRKDSEALSRAATFFATQPLVVA